MNVDIIKVKVRTIIVIIIVAKMDDLSRGFIIVIKLDMLKVSVVSRNKKKTMHLL